MKFSSFLFVSLFAFSSLFAGECCQEPLEIFRASVQHQEGSGLSYSKGYTSAEAFIAPGKLWTCFPFLDLRAHLFNSGSFAANADIGVRYLQESLIWGVYAGYDFRETSQKNYNQINLGFETLANQWEVRANGYIPVGSRRTSLFHPRFVNFEGHHIIIKTNRDIAMYGIDAEAGGHFYQNRHFDVYFGIGPYVYFSSSAKTFAGGRARLTTQLTKYVTLEGRLTCDSFYHTRGEGIFSLNFPLGRRKDPGTNTSCPLAAQIFRRRAVQSPFRNEIIVVERRKTKRAAIDPLTGEPYFIWFVDNTSSSNGTFESPFSTLAAAQTASSPNHLIYVFPGDGTTTGMSNGYLMKDNQQLLGSGIEHQLTTTLGTITIPQFTNNFPMMTNTGGSGVTLANNNTVSGMNINLPSGAGITSGGAISDITGAIGDPAITHATIINNIISVLDDGSSQRYGIAINGIGLVTVSHNTLLGDTAATSVYQDGAGISASQDHSLQVVIEGNSTNGWTRPLNVVGVGNASITAFIFNNTVPFSLMHGIAAESKESSQIQSFIFNNTVSISSPSNGGIFGIIVHARMTSSHQAAIFNNQISINGPGMSQVGIQASTNDDAFLAADIYDNSVLDNSSNIFGSIIGGSPVSISIRNNTVSGIAQGITVTTITQNSTACILGNTVLNTGSPGIVVATTDPTGSMCLNLKNNTSTAATGFSFTISDPARFQVEPLVGNVGTTSFPVYTSVPEGTCNCNTD